MPLKQEQASPERPRCMGGANEHWGFRNPSRRQTEQRENVNGLNVTAIADDGRHKAKDFQNNAEMFLRRRGKISRCRVIFYSVFLSVCLNPSVSTLEYVPRERGREEKKKKKVRKSHAQERGEQLFSGRVPDSAEVPAGAVRGRLTVCLWGHGRSSFNKELIIRHNEATK